MKKWNEAEVIELKVTETQYGGNVTNNFDYVYQNAEGNWEGTFVPS